MKDPQIFKNTHTRVYNFHERIKYYAKKADLRKTTMFLVFLINTMPNIDLFLFLKKEPFNSSTKNCVRCSKCRQQGNVP